jgi:hypothetical protein
MAEREIKFRAWNGKEMFNIDVLAISPCTWDCPDYGKKGVSLAYQPHIKVMQWTGLKDRNGKGIYEGDILKTRADDRDILTCEVVFESPSFSRRWLNENTANFRGQKIEVLPWNTHILYEVIGNIYENPKLLEGK